MLSLDEYAQLLFENSMKDIQISIRTYPIIADNAEELYDFISGSALIPYQERLHKEQQEAFHQSFLHKISQAYKHFPAIYPFKRLLMHAVKG